MIIRGKSLSTISQVAEVIETDRLMAVLQCLIPSDDRSRARAPP
jgi:hypothetical protein